MYLYIPISGRSVVVGEYSISSTGMQFDEPILCLEEALGTILTREGEEVLAPVIETPTPEPTIISIPIEEV